VAKLMPMEEAEELKVEKARVRVKIIMGKGKVR